MATLRLPILTWATVPDASGNVFFEKLDVKATNDVWDRMVCIFNDTSTRLGLAGGFTVPKNYVGNAKLVVVWTSTATTGTAVFDFDYRAISGNDTESLDQTGTQETVTGSDVAPGAAMRRLEVLISLTSANLAADDEVEFEFFRDGTDGSETLAAAVIVFNLLLEYTDV